MNRKIIGLLLASFLTSSLCFAAWDATKPADNEKLKDTPAKIRANWAAIADGTDPALLITNAKIAATAGIVDTKLAQITTSGKVSGTALTLLGSVPIGGGQLPIVNGGTGASSASAALAALLPTQSGNVGKSLQTDGTSAAWGFPTGLSISSQAQGDILFYNGTSWTRLAAGTNGYLLKTQGVGANPVFADPSVLTFNTTTGHDHNGANSKKVVAATLDLAGITNQHVLYNNNGTLAGKTVAGNLELVETKTLSGGAGSYTTTFSSLSPGVIYKLVFRIAWTNGGNAAFYLASNTASAYTSVSNWGFGTNNNSSITFISPTSTGIYLSMSNAANPYITLGEVVLTTQPGDDSKLAVCGTTWNFNSITTIGGLIDSDVNFNSITIRNVATDMYMVGTISLCRLNL